MKGLKLITVLTVFIQLCFAKPKDPASICAKVSDNTDVLLPNPQNCSTYFQCVHQQPLVRPCPRGLHFSTTTNRCEWPTIAKCDYSGMCDGVPETEDVLLPNPDNCSTYYQCVHQEPVLRNCAEGLDFCVKTNRCEFREDAGCR